LHVHGQVSGRGDLYVVKGLDGVFESTRISSAENAEIVAPSSLLTPKPATEPAPATEPPPTKATTTEAMAAPKPMEAVEAVVPATQAPQAGVAAAETVP
jgi:hypothetical protein